MQNTEHLVVDLRHIVKPPQKPSAIESPESQRWKCGEKSRDGSESQYRAKEKPTLRLASSPCNGSPCQDSWVVLFSTPRLPSSEEAGVQRNKN
ncbi:hypothetical protein I79_002658 [Cricetulus griseus]|uniref:Uncharacterized protein n=1 Tax=Cricetulus griseus TaxID=10029 RepID=G3GY07_CRIGR|nr:hypothetical protein I79_002658 [Cricetulus griseus]